MGDEEKAGPGVAKGIKNQGESVDRDMAIVCCPPSAIPINSIQATSVGVSTSPLERAEGVRANLPPQFPSFVKAMLKSHVSGGFWLGLPSKFCLAHLPKHDETVFLVDENGKEYNTKYLVGKTGLSAGWRGFSIAHDLRDNDVLVFQLIEPCKFKVYVVRERELNEVHGTTSLLNLHFDSQPIEPDEMDEQPEEAHNPLELVPMEQLFSIIESVCDLSGDERNNSGSQIMDGIRFSDSPLSFKDVHSFEDFNVHVDGLIIDSEIPTHLRTKYYKLCLSQRMFLHENLLPGLNTKLAAGMISETINIADAIRVAKPSTCPTTNLESWDKTLKALEDLGMVVGFLRTWIHKLLSLGREHRAMIERKRSERDEAEEEIRGLRMKVLEVEKWIGSIDAEIDDLKVKSEQLVDQVRVAPW